MKLEDFLNTLSTFQKGEQYSIGIIVSPNEKLTQEIEKDQRFDFIDLTAKNLNLQNIAKSSTKPPIAFVTPEQFNKIDTSHVGTLVFKV